VARTVSERHGGFADQHLALDFFDRPLDPDGPGREVFEIAAMSALDRAARV
jgi:hypothetical protein